MATARWWIAERVAGAAREAVSPTARRGLARERAARPHRPAVASSPDEPAGRGGGEGIRRAPTRGGLRVHQAGGPPVLTQRRNRRRSLRPVGRLFAGSWWAARAAPARGRWTCSGRGILWHSVERHESPCS